MACIKPVYNLNNQFCLLKLIFLNFGDVLFLLYKINFYL